MNDRAYSLGLTDTHFVNATGLDQPNGRSGNVGSAKDVARLMAYTWKHAPLALDATTALTTAYTSEDGFIHTAENTNEYVYHTPGLLGSKTGYTKLAGGNLSVIYNSGLSHPVVVVVLGSTREGRFKDVDTLVDATYDYIASGWYSYETAGSTPRG
jgi:D-alanyl-D-alanine carboxypeptidase (penicillin-binding protein 5/6)